MRLGEGWLDILNSDLENGWTNLEHNPLAQYRKRQNGHVEMRGVVAGGEAGTVFTFPEDYWHTYKGSLHFPVAGSRGTNHVYVGPDGELVSLLSVVEVGWFSLAPIQFSIT